MSYKVGRRGPPGNGTGESLKFEHLIKDKLVAAGFQARRVPLSGRQRPEGAGELDIPNADLIVENRFFGKAKTTKAKKYVSFPEGEVMELEQGKQDFLVFNFSRTQPFVVVRFEDFLDLLKMWKEKGRAGAKGAAAKGKPIPPEVPDEKVDVAGDEGEAAAVDESAPGAEDGPIEGGSDAAASKGCGAKPAQ